MSVLRLMSKHMLTGYPTDRNKFPDIFCKRVLFQDSFQVSPKICIIYCFIFFFKVDLLKVYTNIPNVFYVNIYSISCDLNIITILHCEKC
jgi:hypothetical protein